MTIIEEGALGRITADFEHEGETIRAGELVTVEDYMPPTDEPGYYSDSYYASSRGGLNNLVVPSANIEQVLSASETRNRKLPTPGELVSGLMSNLASAYGDDWETHSADMQDEGEVTIYGTTNDGLDFAFVVTVSSVEQTDY